MVAVDVINMLGDAISFVINIVTEKIKQKQTQSQSKLESRKRILLLDTVGGVSSFIILLGIVIWGAYSANVRLSNPLGNPINNGPAIFGYAVLNLVIDIVVFVRFSHLANIAVGDGNSLNLTSGAMHLGIDAARCIITIIVSSSMLWHPQLSVTNALADAVGALLLCVILGFSSVLIAVQTFESWKAYNSLRNEGCTQNLLPSPTTQELQSGK